MNKIKINAVEPIPVPVNHIFCVDVSGSMYGSLPQMRSHLKAKLCHLVKPTDTVSIVYFADNRSCGVAVDGAVVTDVTSYSSVCTAIDRYLTPQGCTSFVGPLKLSVDVANRLSNGKMNNLIFMTDGYDNCNSTNNILEATEHLAGTFAGIAIVEYGWYCNRPLLTKMAEISGAVHIFTESYAEFEPVVDALLSSTSAKKVPVELDTDYGVYIDGDQVVVAKTLNGVVMVPEYVTAVYAADENLTTDDVESLYVGVFFGVHTMKPDMVWDGLRKLGDVRLINLYTNCFTKQDYSYFKESIRACIIDVKNRFLHGVDYNMVPAEDAYTVLHVLDALQKGDNTLVQSHPDFEYNRIGKARSQKQDDTVEKLHKQLLLETDMTKVVEVATQIAGHEEWTPAFVGVDAPVSMNKLVFNETRPNISINTVQPGTIGIPESAVTKYGLPATLDSKIYRNYAVVKDGIINMKKLPVQLDFETFTELKANGVVQGEYSPSEVYVIDLVSYPLINRKMVKPVSLVSVFEQVLQLETLKAEQKVLNSIVGTSASSVGLLEQYGQDAADWLSSNGIRDYGFSPKTVAAESTDVYLSKELAFKIAGLSALPSINAVTKKIDEKKKLNLGDHLMKLALDKYKQYRTQPVEGALLEMLQNDKKVLVQAIRDLQTELNKIVYSVVVGQIWFSDCESLEDNTISLDVKSFGSVVKCTAVLEEKEIKI